jgi:hypothetical protein
VAEQLKNYAGTNPVSDASALRLCWSHVVHHASLSLRRSRPWGVTSAWRVTTPQDFDELRRAAECAVPEVLTDQSVRDTSEEIRARELEAVPTLIHTQLTKDRFLRDFAEPTES